MELKITHLFTDESPFVPFDMSNNVATLGADAGRLTWQASKECAAALIPPLLDTHEKLEEWREYVEGSGGWTREEIDKWDAAELNALLLQWIAGDVREAFGDADVSAWDWADYEERAKRGSIAGNLFKSGDEIYFYVGC